MTIAKCIKQKNKLNNAEDKADFEVHYQELLGSGVPSDEAFTQAAETMLEAILEERNELAADVRNEGGYLEDITIEQLLAPEDNSAKDKVEDDNNLKNTDDVGVELSYNIRQSGITIKDIYDADSDAKKQLLAQKKKVWKRPDYEAMVDGGVEPIIAHVVKQVYDSIASKPPNVTDEYIEAYVEGVEAIRKAVDDLLSDKAAIDAIVLQMGNKAGRRRVGSFSILNEFSHNDKSRPEDYLLNKVFPKNDEGVRWGASNPDGNLRANALGKAYQNLEVSLNGFVKGMQAIKEDGWPKKMEVWERKYRIKLKGDAVEVASTKDRDGNDRHGVKVGVSYLERFDTKQEAQDYFDTLPEWFVVKKDYGRLVDSFETEAKALEYVRNLYKRAKKEETFIEPSVDVQKSVREGRDYREGKSVSSADLLEVAGFKGINFGNWMKGKTNAKERQAHINSIYDSVHDLAELIDVPVKAISLNGMLGIAVGAQGRAGAAAHFVPGINEINITRGAGAGSLAHEFGHAIDHYFANLGDLSKRKINFMTDAGYRGAGEGVRPEIAEHFKTIVNTMKKVEKEYTKEEIESNRKELIEIDKKYLERWLKPLKEIENQTSQYKDILALIEKGEIGKYRYLGKSKNMVGENIHALREEHKKIVGRYFPLDRATAINSYANSFANRMDAKKYHEDHPKTKQERTDYYNGALSKANESNKKGYWESDVEMFARAFEIYVAEKLAEKQAKNDYLTSSWKMSTEGELHEEAKLRHPQGEERKVINEAIDALIKEIKHKETADGVAMFSKDKPIKNKKSIPVVETHAILDDLAPFLSSNIGRTRGVSDVVVVPNFSVMPDAIKNEAQKQGSDGSDVYGVYHGDKIYINNENMASRVDVERTVFHEATHKGLKDILGDKKIAFSMNKLMMAIGGGERFNKLASDLNVDLDAYVDGVNQKHEDGSYKFTKSQREHILVEELLAHIGERGSKGLKQKALDLLGAIRNWLRDHGFAKLAKLGKSDLSFIAKSARENGLKNKTTKREDIRFMFDNMASPKQASVITSGGVEFDVSFSIKRSAWIDELEKLAELEEPIILEGEAPQNEIIDYDDGIDYNAEKSLFLSNVPKGTVYRPSTSRTSVQIRLRSAGIFKQISSGSDARIVSAKGNAASKIGAFDGFSVFAKTFGKGKDQTLRIEYTSDLQVAEGKTDSPILTLVVDNKGELTIFSADESSDTFKWMNDNGYASLAKGADGEVVYGGLDGGAWTRLEGVKRQELFYILGDAHARLRKLTGRKKVGLYWTRSTGAKGGTEQDGSAVFFSRKSQSSDAPKTSFDKALNKVTDGKAGTFIKRNLWGALKPRQIAEQLKRILPNIEASYLKDMNRMEAVKNQYKYEAGDIAKQRKSLTESENDQLSIMQHEATIAGVDPAVDYLAIIAPLEGQKQINVLFEKMRGRSGGKNSKMMQEVSDIKMMIGQEVNRKKAAPKIGALWLELNSEQKAIYKLERDFHVSIRNAQQAALLDRIAQSEVDESVRKKLMDSLERQFGFNNVEEPYFPLARFGEFWVHAETNSGTTYDMFETLGEWEAFKDQVTEEGGKVMGAGKTPNEFDGEKMGMNAEFVSEVDDLISALGDDPQIEELRDKVYQVYLQALPSLSARKHNIHRKKTKGFHHDHLRAFASGATHGANLLGRLTFEHKLKRTLDEAQRAVDLASSIPLYKKTLDEIADYRGFLEDALGFSATEIRTKINEFKKKKLIDEAEKWDRYRLLLKQVGSSKTVDITKKEQADAVISRIEYREEQLASADLIKQKEKQVYAADALAELRASHKFAMNPITAGWSSMLNAIGFVWFLGATPAAALVNMTQTPAVAFPLIGARFGFKNASKELAKATADYYRNGKLNKEFIKSGQFSIEKSLKTEGEIKAFKWFHDVGLLDKTLVQDLQGVSDNGINTGEFKHKFLGATAYMFHRAESANREITAIAAYRAGINNGLSHDKAMEAAEYLTWKSHFDYGSHNRARVMRGNGARVITQFKQYSQEIFYLYTSTFKEAFTASGATSEEKLEAKKALTMMYATQFAVAGSLGLFGASTVMAIAEALTDWDEDEPEEIKADYRNWLADNFGKTGGRVAAKGLIDGLTPISMHGRLTLSDLWLRTSDRELEGSQKQLELFKAIMGPMSSIGSGFVTGFEMIGKGHVERGIEQMVPKFVKDSIKANRYLREDAKTMRGLDIKDMSKTEAALKLIGFASSDLSDQYEQNNAIGNITKRRQNRRSNLIDRMIQARENGDVSEQRELNREITRWNLKNPTNKINARTLTRSGRSKERMQKQMSNGMRQTKQNSDLMKRFDFAN